MYMSMTYFFTRTLWFIALKGDDWLYHICWIRDRICFHYILHQCEYTYALSMPQRVTECTNPLVPGRNRTLECHRTRAMINQHWLSSKIKFRVMVFVITWSSVGPDLCRHMAPLSPTELNLYLQNCFEGALAFCICYHFLILRWHV